MNEEKRGSFGGSLGFVLAAAGSAVGLGNIWRFPYLAAKDGGGLFLVFYLVLAVTFGFTLLTTEIAIGRKTRQSPLAAYGKINKKWNILGLAASVVPFLITPYYMVIGGWVFKYFIAFLTGQGKAAATDGYFNSFISEGYQQNFFMTIFLIICGLIVYLGVDKGIEKTSKIIMPILFVLVICIAGYSLTLKHTNESGQIITGLDGLKVYLIPNVKGMDFKDIILVGIDALNQLFFSLSIAMGIMITYGSYVSDDTNLGKSINQIEFFDTFVAILAGIMIIPAVYVFSGSEGLKNSGPSLMFVALPKVFMQMGAIGHVIGTLFFAMVLFAAITSAVSLLEAVISSYMDGFNLSRRKALTVETINSLAIGTFVCLGYNLLYFEVKLPNGSTGQLLDILDYISNYLFMPLIAFATCILIGWVAKPKYVLDEVSKNGESFGRKGLYKVMIKYLAPILVLVLFIMTAVSH